MAGLSLWWSIIMWSLIMTVLKWVVSHGHIMMVLKGGGVSHYDGISSGGLNGWSVIRLVLKGMVSSGWFH